MSDGQEMQQAHQLREGLSGCLGRQSLVTAVHARDLQNPALIQPCISSMTTGRPSAIRPRESQRLKLPR